MTKVKSLRHVYQLTITLEMSNPPIWRRVLVDSRIDLESFHHLIQIVMGWEDAHLHEFEKAGKRYGMPDEDFPSDVEEEGDYRLDQLLKKKKDKLIYTYDFGDNWRHNVVLEAILPFDPEQRLPVCIDGERAGPIEDCGGVPGYEHLVEVLSDPSHPDYEDMAEWLDDIEIDPEAFSLDEINALLRKVFVRR